MRIDQYIVSDGIVATKCTFQRYIDCVDIAKRSSARGRQTKVRWQKQVFIHSRLLRAYLALARLSCTFIETGHREMLFYSQSVKSS